MPLNSTPPTADGAAFDAKLAAARRDSSVDFGLWGALVPGAALEELAERGVIGFKAFMSNSGIEDFARADDVTLYEGMATARPAGPAGRRPRRERRADGPRRSGRRCATGWTRGRWSPSSRRSPARSRSPGHGLRAAHRARVERGRRRAGDRGACARRRRDLRDVPALPVPHARAGRAARAGGQVRAADPRRGGPGRAVGAPARGRDRLRHVRPLPQLARPEGRGRSARPGAGSRARRRRWSCWPGALEPQLVARMVTGAAARFGIAGKGAIEPGADADLALVDLSAEYTLRPRTCATGTRSRPMSGGGCRPASCAPSCAGWTRRPAWASS